MKKILICITLNLFSHWHSQSLNILPSSPNTKAFTEYGKIPVDMYRGKPQINILLFSNGSTDISMSYNVNSIKPSTLPTWVGLGWNLNVGGAITRIVNSLPDEYYRKEATPYNILSYLDNLDQYLSNDAWSTMGSLQTYYNNSIISVNSPSFSVRDVKTKSSPDEFNINIMGIVGSFYMNEKQQWVGRTRDGKTFKIQHIYKNDYVLKEQLRFRMDLHTIKRVLYGFNIVMDDGTKYIFGQDDNAIEFVNNVPDLKNYNDQFNSRYVPTSWQINEIIFSNGKHIKFSYERDNWTTFIPSQGSCITKYWKKINSSSAFLNEVGGYKFLSSLYNVYIRKIENENFTVEFNKSPSINLQYKIEEYTPSYQDWGDFEISRKNNMFKLDNISIYTTAYKKVSEINFNYNNSTTERLHLENISINNTEKYNFVYNPLKLPDFTSTALDGWKFYKGPDPNPNFNVLGATPEQLKLAQEISNIPNFDYSMAEVLNKINYPNGGHVDFEYELNEYSKFGDKDKNYPELKLLSTSYDTQAGGLRIKRIRKCPQYNLMDCNEKTYSYIGDDGRSSGILPLQFKYIVQVRGDNYNIWSYNNNSFQSLNDDNSVTYSKVTENDGNGGKSETYYTNFDTPESNDIKGINYFYGYPNSDNFFNQLPYTSLSYMRGKPLKVNIFNNFNQNIQTTNYKYQRLNNYIRSYGILDYVAGQGIPLDDSGDSMTGIPALNDFGARTYFFILSAYNINLETSFLVQKETTYNNIKVTDKYSYDYTFNNLMKQETLFSDNSSQTVNYTYSSNQYLKDKYIVGKPLLTDVYKIINGVSKNISKKEIKYPVSQIDADLKTSGFALPTSQLSFDIQNPTDTNNATTEVTYDQYDTKGNLQQYTTKDGISTVIIWGYNQTQPIAKIENAKLADIGQSFITAIVNASNTDAAAGANNDETNLLNAFNTFRGQLPGYKITTYSYDPLIGVRSITPPSGIREVYVYDAANRLKEIREQSQSGNLLKEFKYNYKQ
ncbi:RHS repeat domain-containing protein [Chryseobacterium indologenes]|uniref:hypothetical protein n=1 Tax=Chryseobacterium indologenes TaxID=253 RepID=UPI00162987A8|nr:hypothetical protein [Chryseobacterium indologenes]